MTVGRELVAAQAKDDNLQLPDDDIDWYITQGNKNTLLILETENVPQEDMAPSLYPQPLLATPAPAKATVLAPSMPLSSVSSLTPTSSQKAPSPSISVLDTLVIHMLPHVPDASATPRAVAMEISPP